MKSPTKLKIEYKVDRAGFYCEEDINSTNMAHDKSFDLTIYQSQKHLLPDDQKHEYKYTNKPKIIKFYAMDITGTVKLKEFSEDYMYISFESESGCQI